MRLAGDYPDRVSTVAGFHGGGLVTDANDSPHLWLKSTRARVLLRHADNDSSMTPEQMDVLARAAAEAGVTVDQDVYRNAPHGYVMADTSLYDHGAAEQHFVELQKHLAETLA
jgi:carboxymethylenebutenolidase